MSENIPDVVWHAFRGEVDDVKKLIEADNSLLETKTSEGSTPLIAAAWGGQDKVVEYLLTKKASVNAQNSEHGWTALHAAAQNGHITCVKLLCANGADVLMKDKHGNPPKAYATYHGHTAIKDFLAIKEGEAKKKEGEDGDSGRVCSSCTVQ